ncbi:MAG: hypothetical protein JO060_11045 [Candidatus Eremiobacteraeota bacterium]|nr:hypothetical protein [Candidatus Eremiobacteraeota bacterium]MBV9646773.1 hypothetical protein [Candidatus Eremiobacteraeota bacterium]
MATTFERRPVPNALVTLWNVIVAPATAFEALREQPAWVIAFIVTAVLCFVAQTLMLPATLHAFTAWYPSQLSHDPRTAGMTADQRQAALGMAAGFVRFGALVSALSSLVAALVTGLVLWIASIPVQGRAGFLRLFALAMNVAIVWFGLGQLVTAAIVAARGPDAFTAPWQVTLALPSLAWLAPGAPPKLLGFLAGLNPFSLWSLVLLGAGTASLARIPPAVGYAAAALITVCSCLLYSFAIQP